MKNLLLMPSVGYWKSAEGKYIFDRKFYDGMLLYLDYWPGSITLLIRESQDELPAFGVVEVDPQTYPIQLRFISRLAQIKLEHVQGADIVMASADNYTQLEVSTICRQNNIKCIYIIEYIHETRIQILRLQNISLIKKVKSFLWHLAKEHSRIQAFKKCDGLQANGYPAANAYQSFTFNALLYFDTRIHDQMLVSNDVLDQRLSHLAQNEPLRLAFSGRLVAMKGADHLLNLADLLKKRGVAFKLDIFGDGELQPVMQRRLMETGLSDTVVLHGAVDFATELVPFISQHVDLFICCHRQSDPSCTYLETYSCGVPIAGYNNRAHQGILDEQDVGWSVKMNALDDLAELIARLSRDRTEIIRKSRNAIAFARQHTFEITFRKRMDHCVKTLA
jgi:colanic acid/amylovoran biosynthesis glycosyltransferase